MKAPGSAAHGEPSRYASTVRFFEAMTIKHPHLFKSQMPVIKLKNPASRDQARRKYTQRKYNFAISPAERAERDAIILQVFPKTNNISATAAIVGASVNTTRRVLLAAGVYQGRYAANQPKAAGTIKAALSK